MNTTVAVHLTLIPLAYGRNKLSDKRYYIAINKDIARDAIVISSNFMYTYIHNLANVSHRTEKSTKDYQNLKKISNSFGSQQIMDSHTIARILSTDC